MTDVAALYAEHWERIFRFLARRMPGAPTADVEDLTATVFERVVRFSDRYREQGQANAWLLTVARHALVDRSRRWSRSIQADILDTDTPGSPVRVDAGSDRHVTALAVSDVLREMTARHRMILVERYWFGASDEDTALLLGCTRSAVTKQRDRALARVRRELRAG